MRIGPVRKPSIRLTRTMPSPNTRTKRTAIRTGTVSNTEHDAQPSRIKPPYIPRHLYMAGVRQPSAGPGGNGKALQLVTGAGFETPTDPWKVALLFRDSQ